MTTDADVDDARDGTVKAGRGELFAESRSIAALGARPARSVGTEQFLFEVSKRRLRLPSAEGNGEKKKKKERKFLR